MDRASLSSRWTILAEFMRFGLSCGVVLGAKLGTMWLCLKFFDPLISYLLVQMVVFWVSYVLHVSFSFRSVGFSVSTICRYFQTVLSFKVIDYILFSVIFAYFHIDALLAVLLTSLGIMLLRFTAVRRSLAGTHESYT